MTGSRTTVNRPLIRLAGFALILLNCGVAIVFIYVWLSASQKDYFKHADFTTFYAAGAIARDGLGAQMYDLRVQTEYQAKLFNQNVDQTSILPFNNPPFTAYPFILFSLLPLDTAFIVWTVLQLGMLLWLLYLLYQVSKGWKRMERALMISGVLAFTPLIIDFMLGTFSLLLLFSLFQFYINLKKERIVSSAAWLVLMFIKPQIVLLPGILLFGARRWKTIGVAVILGACLFVVTTLSFGWRIWLDFARNINSASANFNSFGIVPAIEYNLKGFLTMILGDDRASLINLVSLAALLISFVLVLWIWRGPWQVNGKNFELKFSLVTMLSLVLSLHLNPYDSLLLILPAILFYNYLRKSDASGTALGIFMVCCPYIFLIDFFILNGRAGFHFPFVLMAVVTLWISRELVFGSRPTDLLAVETSS
jgi:hypothetical protein